MTIGMVKYRYINTLLQLYLVSSFAILLSLHLVTLPPKHVSCHHLDWNTYSQTHMQVSFSHQSSTQLWGGLHSFLCWMPQTPKIGFLLSFFRWDSSKLHNSLPVVLAQNCNSAWSHCFFTTSTHKEPNNKLHGWVYRYSRSLISCW